MPKKPAPIPLSPNTIKAKAAATLHAMHNKIGNEVSIAATLNRLEATRANKKAKANASAAKKAARTKRAPKPKDPAIVAAAQKALRNVGLTVTKTASRLSPNAIKKMAKKTMKNLGLN